MPCRSLTNQLCISQDLRRISDNFAFVVHGVSLSEPGMSKNAITLIYNITSRRHLLRRLELKLDKMSLKRKIKIPQQEGPDLIKWTQK